MTVRTRVKCVKAEGQKALSQLGWRHNEDKMLHFLTQGGLAGTKTSPIFSYSLLSGTFMVSPIAVI